MKRKSIRSTRTGIQRTSKHNTKASSHVIRSGASSKRGRTSSAWIRSGYSDVLKALSKE